jgi:hypothetical protein
MQSWRGLIARKQVFAGEPFEILGLHCRSCSERGTMCLPAHGAMAIQRPSQRSIDAIANLTAQATAFDSHASVPFRDIRCHLVPSGTIIINGKLLFADSRPSAGIRATDRIAGGGKPGCAVRSGRRPRRGHSHGSAALCIRISHQRKHNFFSGVGLMRMSWEPHGIRENGCLPPSRRADIGTASPATPRGGRPRPRQRYRGWRATSSPRRDRPP